MAGRRHAIPSRPVVPQRRPVSSPPTPPPPGAAAANPRRSFRTSPPDDGPTRTARPFRGVPGGPHRIAMVFLSEDPWIDPVGRAVVAQPVTPTVGPGRPSPRSSSWSPTTPVAGELGQPVATRSARGGTATTPAAEIDQEVGRGDHKVEEPPVDGRRPGSNWQSGHGAARHRPSWSTVPPSRVSSAVAVNGRGLTAGEVGGGKVGVFASVGRRWKTNGGSCGPVGPVGTALTTLAVLSDPLPPLCGGVTAEGGTGGPPLSSFNLDERKPLGGCFSNQIRTRSKVV